MNKDILQDVFRAAPWVQVVISSTWRHSRSLKDFQAMFSQDIGARLIGMTPAYSALEDIKETLAGYEREAECVGWLVQQGAASEFWLALDDRPWLFRPFNSNVFLVDGEVGLTESTAQELLRVLTNL